LNLEVGRWKIASMRRALTVVTLIAVCALAASGSAGSRPQGGKAMQTAHLHAEPPAVMVGQQAVIVFDLTTDTTESGATFSDTLPSGVAFVSVTTTLGTCSGTTTVTCSMPTVPPGTFTIQITVKATTAGVYPNTATYTWSWLGLPPITVDPGTQLTVTAGPGPPSGTASGTVLVNGKKYTSGQPIPYGSIVDVTHGRLTLKTEAGTLIVYGAGVSAVFKLLKFKVNGKVIVELRLIQGDFPVCSRALAVFERRKPPAKTVRRLYARGKGAFRTRGRYSSSTVRGTFWLTADRCDGTLTSVKQGKVQVLDFVKHKKVLVKAGQSYLAVPKR
jgi:uncharacterized repeat protein (TIGR01451 family)